MVIYFSVNSRIVQIWKNFENGRGLANYSKYKQCVIFLNGKITSMYIQLNTNFSGTI